MKGLMVGLALVAASALIACGSDDSGGGSPSTEGNEDLLTSAGFQKAVDAVEGEKGADAAILRVQVNAGGAEFQIRDGEQATGFVYTGGELEDLQVDVVGPGTLEGTDFPLSEVDPAAIDKIAEGVKQESGIDDIAITNLTLEKAITDSKLKWVITAEGGGRTGLVFNADPDGSNVTSPTGDVAGADKAEEQTNTAAAGVENIPQPSEEQQAAIAECVQNAAGDADKIAACGELVQP